MTDHRLPLPLNFCLEGFRLIRQRPKLILFWGIITLFGNGVGIGVAVALVGPALQSLVQALTAGDAKPEAVGRLLSSAMPGISVAVILSTLAGSVVTAAVCRAVSGDRDDRLGFLQFGLTELRLIFINLIMLALSLGLVVGCAMLADLFASLFAAVPGANEAFASLALMTSFGVGLWLNTRLSLNLAQSFATGRIDILGSFYLTRGYFRQLFFGYGLAILLAFAVLCLCSLVETAVITLLFGDVGKPDLVNLSAYLTPANVVDIVLSNGLVSPLLSAILQGAPVAAYYHIGRQGRGAQLPTQP